MLCGAVSGKMRYGRCGFETARVEVAQVAHEQVRGTGPASSRLHVTRLSHGCAAFLRPQVASAIAAGAFLMEDWG